MPTNQKVPPIAERYRAPLMGYQDRSNYHLKYPIWDMVKTEEQVLKSLQNLTKKTPKLLKNYGN